MLLRKYMRSRDAKSSDFPVHAMFLSDDRSALIFDGREAANRVAERR